MKYKVDYLTDVLNWSASDMDLAFNITIICVLNWREMSEIYKKQLVGRNK